MTIDRIEVEKNFEAYMIVTSTPWRPGDPRGSLHAAYEAGWIAARAALLYDYGQRLDVLDNGH